ncbi:MAG TPA: GGDEF domain-containing phosphodiesterase [Steroidobacteraceae bacterium]|jgi:EAL domain-containing protein (putative c-di-GMP-specific phosphodiesterase class I)/GGDEF domain-containing protein
MSIEGEKPPLLVLDPAGAANGRAAKKALARLSYPQLVLTESGAAAGSIANGYPAVVLIVTDAATQDPAALCAGLADAATTMPPALILLSAKALASVPDGLAAQFVAPFDWEAVVDRLDQLLMLASLRRERSALGTLLQLSRVELLTIDTESQACRVNDTLAVLLGMPGADTPASRRDRAQPIHWQKLFNHGEEPDRQRVLDTVSGAFESGMGFELEYDVRIERHHKRRLRLTGHPTNGAPGSPPRRLDLVIQDVTPVESRTTADAANRLLDTTLGLRHGDRVLQSLMRIGQDYKKGTILLLRLHGLADFYRQHGYETGGVLLRTFAEAIESSLRDVPGVVRINPNKNQVLARLAGGEFVVPIPDMTDDQSMVGPLSRLLEGTRKAISTDERLKLINTRLGMATWPKDGSSPDVILKAASLACDYFSMGECDGPGTLMAAVVRAREQARLEYELHRAIERGQLQLHYQPKLSLPDGRIVGFEGLLRWQHQKGMFVPPAIFIPIAERTGLIATLGDWVIENAAEQIAKWRSEGLGQVQTAVNVSPQQMVTGDVVASIRGACTRHIIEPLFLQVELTESCLIDDAETAMKLLAEIRHLGCQIALDDFGTGFSSLSYLRRLPLDILKIDRSFITAIGEERGDSNLAFNILGIGRSLGLKVIAEGVASAAQWDALCRWKCTEAQGYLISQPVNASLAGLMWQHGRWDAAAHKLRLPEAAATQTAA